ncbi:chemotaxis regulatory protein ChePep [Helicobacter pylori]
MKMILFNQNPMIAKLLESVSKKLELSIENFNHYQELSAHLKKDPEWLLIADDECLEKLDQVDWLELKEIISQNKNSVCMYKKGNEMQPFLEDFEVKIKKPFLPTEMLKVLQKKLGSNASELEPSQNLDPTQEVLETNWDELENLGDLEALVQEEPNNEEQLLPTLNDQKEKEEVKEEEKEEVKEEEKEEVKETPQEEEKPKDNEIQEGETQKNEEVSKELETQEELEIPKEETQEIKEEKQEKTQEQAKEQEPIKEETQEIKEEKQEKTQDSPSAQELEAMQELVKEIQENSNGQENKKETQENTETPQEKEKQDVETPQELEKQELETQEKEKQDVETPQEKEKQDVETPQEKETQENTETPQELEKQELETQEKTQESAETPQEKTQKLEAQKDHYESIEDIPEPVMAQAMGEELPFLNESVAKIPNNENDTETPKESAIKTPQEKEESDKTSSPLELRLNLQDLLKSLNQESLKSLLENKTLSIKITLEDKKPDA